MGTTRYDYRVGLLGVSMVCFAAGIGLALNLLSVGSGGVGPDDAALMKQHEALRILAETYGVRPSGQRF
jgi:hypothetical protein